MTERLEPLPEASPSEMAGSAENGMAVKTLPDSEAFARKTLTQEDLAAIEQLVTEDDTPVDNMFSEKQRRLLTHPLNVSWPGSGEGRPFLAVSDVGVFLTPYEPSLVPDAFLSLDVVRPADWWQKEGRSYFVWQYKKPPDVAFEVVSNSEGGETGVKFERYARFGVPYHVVDE